VHEPPARKVERIARRGLGSIRLVVWSVSVEMLREDGHGPVINGASESRTEHDKHQAGGGSVGVGAGPPNSEILAPSYSARRSEAASFMNMKTRILVPVWLVLALLAAACGGSEEQVADVGDVEPTQGPTAEPAPEPDPTPAPTSEPEPDPTEVPTVEPEPEPEPEPESEPQGNTALAGGCGSGAVAGTTTETFAFEDRDRTFERVVPTSYDDSTPMPVVLNWHGLGSSGAEQLVFSDYASLAQTEGFIVIAPTGVPAPGDTRNSWELDPSQDPTRDDLAFANELLDIVIESLCVDETRVYTTGMSNGGYFSSVLVCEMSDRIAAAASIAALSHADDCDPARIVPYIGFHGTDDAVVPFAGGGESSLAPGEVVPLFLLEIPAEFAEFAVAAGCDAEPAVTQESEHVTSYDYLGCADDVEMTFYEIADAGHTWPGSLISLAISQGAGLGVTTNEISASQTSWDFFEQYSLPTE